MTRQQKLKPAQRLALLAALVFALLPLLWLLSTSFKPLFEFFLIPVQWLPVWPTLENYRNVFYPYIDPAGFPQSSSWRAIFTSGVIALSATCLSVGASLMAAFAISRHRAGGSRTLMFILSFRAAPPMVIAVPIAAVITSAGLNDPYSGLILVYAAYTAPIATLMLKSFIDQVPAEIEEAAMMDGYSRWQSHLFITTPLIKSGLAATFLFVFILCWGEGALALALSSGRWVTIPVQLVNKVYSPHVQSALAVLALPPLLILGFFLQPHLSRGFTFGAIKN
ncbi:MAG: carbohydrate ABC transporter permease [Rhodospirillaceae bacterium]|jgi:multiple sugar transport system permease protein|nr:carbohydrate ABC transporter permease [Rhodospirillaceae bacterium]